MAIDFQQVPAFYNNQPISAEDINAFLQNNVYIDQVVKSPQPLFMMSHAYAPSTLPWRWDAPTYTFWEGSFMYREGMEYAYIGFHYKLEWIWNINQEFALGNLRNLYGMVWLNNVDKAPLDMLNSTENPGLNPFYAVFDISTATTVTKSGTESGKTYQYVTTIREGAGTASLALETNAGQTYIPANSRISTIRIKINSLGFSDGQIVPVKLAFLTTTTYAVNPITIKSVIWQNLNNIGMSSGIPEYTYMHYGVLYAQTDGDLSYTANWPTTPFTTTGNSVLSQTNLSILSTKQRYILERLKGRPQPLTGSITYVGDKSGTATLFYPYKDHHLGDEKYTADNYWMPTSETTKEPMYDSSRYMAIPYNATSTLATYSWNPYFTTYDTLYTNFRFYGRGTGTYETRQLLLVEMAEQPTSILTFRKAMDNFFVNRFAPFTLGDNTFTASYYDKAYGSSDARYYINNNPFNSTFLKTYYNRGYNVRIPSPYTPVFSPQYQKYSSEYAQSSNYYLVSGLWEDNVAIRFTPVQTAGAYTSWGLFKTSPSDPVNPDKTIQIGFNGDLPFSTILNNFYNRFTITEYKGSTQLISGNDVVYNYVENGAYNGSNWKWVTNNGVRGYAPVFLNLYDHSYPQNSGKEGTASVIQVIGMSAGSPAFRDYTTFSGYSPETSMTYTQLSTLLASINTELDLIYNTTFTYNPHFTRYDMFWNQPKSPTAFMPLLKEYCDKFFMFSTQRKGNFLVVRGTNVTLKYGDVKTVKVSEKTGKGSLYQSSAVDFDFASSQNIISSTVQQTVVVDLESIGVPTGSQYFLQGDVLYAAEFYEEPV